MSITNMPAIILLTVSISHFTILSVAAQKVIAGALHLNPIDGPAKLESLAAEAPTLPITRLVLSFVRPDMVYIPGSASLKYSDLGYSRSGDFGFAAVKTAISRLQSGGVQVFLSMGGLSNNCYPYLSMKYSVAYFGSGADYWKIAKYGAGSPYKCTASNMWCQVCDFGKYMYNFADLSVFPEPNGTNTWDTARAKVMKLAKGAPVEWNPFIVGGYEYADPHDPSIATTVPGSGYWKVLKRDPYTDFIHLAKELKLDGVDLNYNEIWHADTFRSGAPKGPFKLDQTVYKYSAIALDIMHAIQEIYPSCRFSATVDAKGAWQGTFWGGSLKGLWYYSNLWYPEIIQFMTNSELNGGGVNVKSFDLSNSNDYYECSDIARGCDFAGQVEFLMSTFAVANIEARLGFQVGQPSLPDPTVYAQHQLPLTASALFLLTQSSSSAFIWELFKPKNELPTGISGQPNNVDATTIAQVICKKIFPKSSRCRGSIPEVGGELTGNMSPNIPLPTNTINTSQTNITTLNTFMTTNRNLKTTAFTEDVIITMPTASEPTVPTSSQMLPTTSINVSPLLLQTKTTEAPSSLDRQSCERFGETRCINGISYQCMDSINSNPSLIWTRWFVAGCNENAIQPVLTMTETPNLLGISCTTQGQQICFNGVVYECGYFEGSLLLEWGRNSRHSCFALTQGNSKVKRRGRSNLIK